MLVRPGTVELLEAAVKLGAECIGGLDPSTIDRDPVRHLDTIFAIADRHGVEVDIHLHEPGTLGAFAVELIAERTTGVGTARPRHDQPCLLSGDDRRRLSESPD